ncbi:cell envelope integrity protein TolA [Vibrio palustris]|uniref:Cell envelope integrity inner membrane protein TolA n=1 Tax=Vibrio palustris TaxID=1918946 RepID=A0A1R4B204_9VIBR|nr:cell envelope integrity protein TolA [Vibrio palustris]SJL82917.1 cell envelope integrity inner membrane protein TolA [Vibrio palustris]
MRSKNQNKPQLTTPVIVSIALHAVLVGALIWSADFNLEKPKPKSSGKMVEAVVIDPNQIHQQAEKIRQQRNEAAQKEQARKDRLAKMRREAEQLAKKRKAEEERIRKLKEQQAQEAKQAREAEKARKQREAQEQKAAEEKARQEKARKAKAQAEAKRKAKAAAAAKAAKEKAAKEKAAKEAKARAEREKAKRAAAEKAKQARIAKQKAAQEKAAKEAAEKARLKKIQEEKAKKKEQEQLKDIFNGLQNESSENSAAQAKHVASESQRWGAIYQQLIQKNLLLDDNFKGKECKVNLRLIPTGTGAILKSITVEGGDSRLCRATRAAVAKVDNFPLPKNDPAVVEKLKDINLTVAPE